jgi:hypothetical protein
LPLRPTAIPISSVSPMLPPKCPFQKVKSYHIVPLLKILPWFITHNIHLPSLYLPPDSSTSMHRVCAAFLYVNCTSEKWFKNQPLE